MNRRGLTPLVGFVILVGITAVGAMSLFVAGMALADATQSNAEQEQLERTMTQFADTANEIASSEADSGEFQISGTDDGTAVASEDAGHIEMWVENDTARQRTLLNSSMGAYSYETEENEEVVFQGGGIWRASGDGSSTMVQPPPFEYRNEGDPTLTYEFVRTLDATEGDGDVEGTINRINTTNEYPLENDPNPLQNGAVYMQIESAFCDGWENFFRQRTDGVVQESCDTSVNSDTDEVRIKFSVPFNVPGVSEPVVSESITDNQGTFEHNSPRGYTHASVGNHSHPSPSGVIDSRIGECQSDPDACESLQTSISGPGTYYSAGVPDGDYEIDTSNGDVELVVNGNFNANSLEINGDGNVTLFARGHVMTDPGVNYNHGGSAERFRMLVHSDGYQVGCARGNGGGNGNGNGNGNNGGGSNNLQCGAGGGGSNIHAFVYAPNSDVFIGPGNTQYNGGIVADYIEAHSGGANFNRDSDVLDIELEYEAGGEPFYYLHVSETTLEVEDS